MNVLGHHRPLNLSFKFSVLSKIIFRIPAWVSREHSCTIPASASIMKFLIDTKHWYAFELIIKAAKIIINEGCVAFTTNIPVGR
jgi:hypothetical protein